MNLYERVGEGGMNIALRLTSGNHKINYKNYGPGQDAYAIALKIDRVKSPAVTLIYFCVKLFSQILHIRHITYNYDALENRSVLLMYVLYVTL